MAVVQKNIDENLSTMISELKEECQIFVKLANQLELENLTEDQVDEILGEMTASLAHIHIHSGSLKKDVEK